MEPTRTLELVAVPHPDPRVQRAGFELTDPYLEQCWVALLGPSSVAVLRRMPQLWIEQEPARIAAGELAGSLGLSRHSIEQGALNHTLNRLVRFGFAEWIEPGTAVGIYTTIPPIGPRRLERLPEWSRNRHDQLLGDHLARLARTEPETPAGRIVSRLDRLEQTARDTALTSTAIQR